MIACGNANAQDYLAAAYSTPGDGTCSGKISVFHYAVGGKCFTTDGTTSRKITAFATAATCPIGCVPSSVLEEALLRNPTSVSMWVCL